MSEGSEGMKKGIKYNQDQSSIMLLLELNFRHNAVVLRVTLKSIMLKFSSIMYLTLNDLPNCLAHAEPRMYADDTHLTFATNNMKDIEFYQNQYLANVNQWLIANKLTLNQSKTEFMLIGSRQRLCTFQS